MKILDEDKTLLLIIDIQEKLYNSVFNQEELFKNSGIISTAANILKIPCIITEQYPKGLGKTCSIINQESANIYEKNTFSALMNPDIMAAIKEIGKSQILICGIETHICVSQTSLALIDCGYEVFVAKNACGSRNEQEHLAGLARIKSAGGNIITTEMALFDWLKTSKHAKFKEIQNLIK